MDLKIFEKGKFTEQDYNEFCNKNLTFQNTVLPDGTIYVFYKPVTDLGSRKIDQVEQIDKLVKQAQIETLVANSEKTELDPQIVALKEKISALDPKQGEHKKLTDELTFLENKIRMGKETIENRAAKIIALKTTAESIIPSK